MVGQVVAVVTCYTTTSTSTLSRKDDGAVRDVLLTNSLVGLEDTRVVAGTQRQVSCKTHEHAEETGMLQLKGRGRILLGIEMHGKRSQ